MTRAYNIARATTLQPARAGFGLRPDAKAIEKSWPDDTTPKFAMHDEHVAICLALGGFHTTIMGVRAALLSGARP